MAECPPEGEDKDPRDLTGGDVMAKPLNTEEKPGGGDRKRENVRDIERLGQFP